MIRAKLAELIHSLADVVGGIDWEAEREDRRRANEALARISCDADSRLAWAEEEAGRREELGLLNAVVPGRWRSYYYMRQGYRVCAAQDASQDHWRGGPPQHDGATCPVCKKPLLLFWDLNCNDPRFRAESPELFGDLERLPLYYCCRRPEPTIYQVVSGDRIRTIRPELRSGEESPFRGFPDAFERRPIRLDAIPRDVANLLILTNDFDSDWLNQEEQDRLSEYFGERGDSIWDVHLSQVGGAPTLSQGHYELDCPNADCPTHSMGHPILRNKREYQMKELAVIDVDAGFEMESNYAQIAFHMCWKCLTVHAEYRCD
jgi:hypothetical protein